MTLPNIYACLFTGRCDSVIVHAYVQWSPSKENTVGTTAVCPQYGGICTSLASGGCGYVDIPCTLHMGVYIDGFDQY